MERRINQAVAAGNYSALAGLSAEREDLVRRIDQAAEPTTRDNPIGGEIDLTDQEGVEISEISEESTYGNSFDQKLESPAKPRVRKSTA